MSKLVVKAQALDSIMSAVLTAHNDLVALASGVGQDTAALSGWDPSTASRAAQLRYEKQLLDDVEALQKALTQLRTALVTVKADARACEVKNVAVVG